METIKLDLVPGKKMPSLHASQYDDGRDYHIDLTENRVPYTLDGTETISLTVRKCDNTLVTMDIANTFADKSYIEFRTTEQMNACAGFNYGEITIEKNGTRIGSLNWYLQVEGAPDEGGITSQSEINNLARQVHDIVVEELADNGAEDTGYDNTESGLEATNVQDAIDEVNAKIENIPSVDAYTKQESDQKYATKTALQTVADAVSGKADSNNVYTKQESDNRYVQKSSGDLTKHYGVKWDLTNPDDLGARCFDAVGLSASIGIGATNGSSDFDNVYPWSEMKRCNINKNVNGAEIVTFEGESGFALDGSNGDVFVRIPKFFYERYIKDGYEYRIISDSGLNVHPAFIENGAELDEIFISAFEGYIDGNNKLRSFGGVLPSSNELDQTFLTYAQANGANYSLYDSRCVDLVFTLFAVEFGCRNTNHILGYGLADFEQPATYHTYCVITTSASNTNTVRTAKWTTSQKAKMPIGSNITVCDTTQENILTQAKITACVDGTNYTDWTFDGNPITVTTNCFIGSAAFNTNWCESSPSGALSWHTGRNDWIANSITKNAVRYRWIENIFGNLWHLLPDVTFYNFQMFVCRNMKDYVMHKRTSPYMPEGQPFIENSNNGDMGQDIPNVNYWINALDDNPFTKGRLFGKSYDMSLTSVQAFGGYYYLMSSNRIIANGGGFDHLYRCNITTQRAWISVTQKWYLYGARLMYKHLV